MYGHCLKRIIDFCIALCALIVLSPFMLVFIVILHFANRGAGVFFTQDRPGKDARIFKAVKFKTMTDERDADGNLLPGYGAGGAEAAAAEVPAAVFEGAVPEA